MRYLHSLYHDYIAFDAPLHRRTEILDSKQISVSIFRDQNTAKLACISVSSIT